MFALLAVAFGAAAMAAGCNLEHDAVDKPTYEADVRPIFMARCVRCHGSPPLADPTSPIPIPPPATLRFDVFGDTNCDSDAGGSPCIHGAAYEATAKKFESVLDMEKSGLTQSTGGMPPSPVTGWPFR